MPRKRPKSGCFIVNTISIFIAIALSVILKKILLPKGDNSIETLLTVTFLTIPIFALIYLISFKVLVEFTKLCKCEKKEPLKD